MKFVSTLGRLCALMLLAVAFAAPASAQVCKPTQYDMLEWMAPQISTVNGHFNVVYPETGTFYWVKSPKGFPWDVKTFDTVGIYHHITEYDWNDPYTYKITQSKREWMPRCIDIPQTPGLLTTVKIDKDNTWYDIHTSCTQFTSKQLGYELNEVSGPYLKSYTYTDKSGNIVTTPAQLTLTLAYKYSCDSAYNVCKFKETYDVQQFNGLMEWTYYAWNGTAFVFQRKTTHPGVSLGSITPVHPCW